MKIFKFIGIYILMLVTIILYPVLLLAYDFNLELTKRD